MRFFEGAAEEHNKSRSLIVHHMILNQVQGENTTRAAHCSNSSQEKGFEPQKKHLMMRTQQQQQQKKRRNKKKMLQMTAAATAIKPSSDSGAESPTTPMGDDSSS